PGRTDRGWGSRTKQDTAKAQGEALGKEEVRLTKERYGWPLEPAFLVPDDVRRHMREAGARGEPAHAAWRRRLEHYRSAFPAEALALEAALDGRLPAGVLDGIDGLERSFPAAKAMSTRKASGLAINAIAAHPPPLVGGSADLA